MEETWLMGNYPLPLWNVCESGSVCTNNHVEGWHSRLKKVVGKAHPNKIVEVFKKEQALTEVSLAQLAAGAAPPRRCRRVLRRDRMVVELQQRFTSNSISLEDYLSGVYLHTQTCSIYHCTML